MGGKMSIHKRHNFLWDEESGDLLIGGSMAKIIDRVGKKEEEARWNYKSIIDSYPLESFPAGSELRSRDHAMRVSERLGVLHMTQKDLAEAAGISPQALSKILSLDDKLRPVSVNLERTRLFAAILSCTPHYLLGLTDDPDVKLDRNHNKVEVLFTGIPLPEIAFAQCMEACEDLEFVRCISEIVVKNTPENQLIERAKGILKLAHLCDPDNFELILPAHWRNAEKNKFSQVDFFNNSENFYLELNKDGTAKE